MNLYREKADDYFSNVRTELIELVPRNAENRVLEIGAGNGATLIQLKAMGLALEVVGVDIVGTQDGGQAHPDIDRFIVADIEKTDLGLAEGYFDVIICADVLEHLIDPWKAVRDLGRYLKKGGVFIASFPNIREYTTLKKIVFDGDFRYGDSGILDKTHLRFFCRKNMIELFEDNGFKVVKVVSTFDYIKKGKRVLLNKLFFNKLADFFSRQYFMVVQK